MGSITEINLFTTPFPEKENVIDVADMNILGVHNFENAAAAIAISVAAGVPYGYHQKVSEGI